MVSPEVSVLLVCYNQEATVGRAIESLLVQSGDVPYEIIIADDCSVDSTAAICRDYAERYPERIVMLRREVNMGVAANYFDALAHARGRFVADCAGDDWWPDPGRLARQHAALASDPSLVMVHGRWSERRSDGSVTMPDFGSPAYSRIHPPQIDGREMLEAHFRHDFPVAVHLSTAMFRVSAAREALEAADSATLFSREFGCEDFPLIAALLSRGRVAYAATEELAYSVGGDSLSNDRDPSRSFALSERSLAMTLELAPFYGIAEERMAGFVEMRLRGLVRFAFAARSRNLARRASEWASRLAPLLSWRSLPERVVARSALAWHALTLLKRLSPRPEQ
ncbi:MAG: glycosyltransferase family 2 protein [Paramuribaculum sp.]|nr:glycosyltransferase family 2 protein [Paramuribaculum sp.]